jgi:hypothetical protein
VKAKDADVLTLFCDTLPNRIEIKSINKEGPYWFLWFVPDDSRQDMKSGEIAIGKNSKGQKAIGYVRS